MAIAKYTALVIQPAVRVADTREDIKINLDRVLNMIDFGVGYCWELPVRLAVLPEYFLQGVTTPGKGEHGLKEFMKKAITIPGPEMDALGAQGQGIRHLHRRRWRGGAAAAIPGSLVQFGVHHRARTAMWR